MGFALAMVGLVACNSGGGSKDGGPGADTTASLKQYGERCEDGAECASKLCVDKFCSKLCTRLADCPLVRGVSDPNKPLGTEGGPCTADKICGVGLVCVGSECVRAFDCGEIEPKKNACYPRQYQVRPYLVGYDCSLDDRCANGYTCMNQPGDADRYCSGPCTSDKSCPPTFRCTKVGPRDGPFVQRCVRRLYGHPCTIDDHCGGADDNCVTDINGKGFCGKACSSDTNCPPHARCEEASGGKKQCRFRAGFGYKTGGGGECDPCLFHGIVGGTGADLVEEATCKSGGACVQLSQYSRETGCVFPCNADGKTCPNSSYLCFNGLVPGGKYCAPKAEIPEQPGSYTLGSCHGP